MLYKHPWVSPVPPGQFGAFGEVGIRTLHNIRWVYEDTKELIGTKIKQLDLSLGKANDERLAQIRALVQKWWSRV